MNWKTLVLNADYTPLSITSAVRSVGLIDKNKAFPLEMSSNHLRSEMLRIACPSVVVLSQYVSINRRAAPDPKAVLRPVDRYSVLRRDGHTCQYCMAPATTLDHVVPRSKGGESLWTNLVAACQACNSKKGAKLLSQTDMKLRREPRAPSAHEIIKRVSSRSNAAAIRVVDRNSVRSSRARTGGESMIRWASAKASARQRATRRGKSECLLVPVRPRVALTHAACATGTSRRPAITE